MTVQVSSRVVSTTVVIDVVGRLDFLEFALRETVNAMLDRDYTDFVVNLSEVSYLDSFGLGQLVAVWTSIRNHGGSMKLQRPSARVQRLLDITKLNTVFELANEDGAESSVAVSNPLAFYLD